MTLNLLRRRQSLLKLSDIHVLTTELVAPRLFCPTNLRAIILILVQRERMRSSTKMTV